MNLQELKKTPHLSASSIGDYIDCGLLYKLGRIDKFQPDHQAEALVFGTVIHRVLESYYRNDKMGSPSRSRKSMSFMKNTGERTPRAMKTSSTRRERISILCCWKGKNSSPPIITIISMTTDSRSQESRKHLVLLSMVALFPLSGRWISLKRMNPEQSSSWTSRQLEDPTPLMRLIGISS